MIKNKICSYGCGREAKIQFKNGKYCCEISRNKCPGLRDLNRKSNTGRIHSDKTKEKISSKNKGKNKERYHQFENVENILCSYGCGLLAKYKNLTKFCCESHFSKCPSMIKKNRDRSLKLHMNLEIKNKLKNKVKLSWEKEGRLEKNLNALKKFYENESEEHKRRRITNIRNGHRKNSYLEKMRIWGKENWKNPDYVKKIQASLNLKPNKPEKILINLFNDLGLDFKYTGDFSYWIDGKNPDFLNEKNNKIIEFFGSYYHDRIIPKSRENHESERINHFKNNGYKSLIIWEEELSNIKKLIQKVLQFNEE